MIETSRVQTRLSTVVIELGCPRNPGGKTIIISTIFIVFIYFNFEDFFDQSNKKKTSKNDRLNKFHTTDPRCRMTPTTRPKPHKPSIVLCYIFVAVVTVSLVVSMESRWMLKCIFSKCKVLVVGCLLHAWHFKSGRCYAPPYLLTMVFFGPK